MLERSLLKRIVEAALFAAGQPLSLEKLGELFYEEERPNIELFREVLAEIETDYSERGVQLTEVATGYRFQARQEVGEWVSRLWEEKPQRYSRALLETLALIAYRQPITRGEVEDIRGVSVSSHIIKTLQEREWVRVLGYRDVPGRPAMYGTTKSFLDYFNLKSLEELPTLAEVRDLDKISAELDERLQQTQPQATLPLESTVSEAGIPSLEKTEAPSAEASASVVVDDSMSGRVEARSIDADRLETGGIETIAVEVIAAETVEAETVQAESVTAEAINESASALAPEPSPASTSPATPKAAPITTFSTLRARFASLFDTPADPDDANNVAVPPAAPSVSESAVERTEPDDEIPPSPIHPNDPRLE